MGSAYNIGGSAIAQGTHTGVLAGEFQTDLNGLPITAIKLPAASGSGTPAISDYVACFIGNGFQAGYDPHTVSAYQSPNTGDAMAVFSNGGASTVAIVNLTKNAGSHRGYRGRLALAGIIVFRSLFHRRS